MAVGSNLGPYTPDFWVRTHCWYTTRPTWSPAFQKLIDAIVSEQHRCNDFAKFRVMALSATSRDDAQEKFALTDADRENEEVQKRIGAKKGIAFFLVVDENKIADEVAEHALRYKDSGQAILIFLRKLKDLDKVADKLRKANLRVQVLTGTLRGLERDALAKEDEVFARFMPKREVVPAAGTVFLVCTSAGEVGVNISADHLVSDLTPFDSMAQRFGRVNRFGDGDARIDIIHHTLRRSIATPSAADSSEMAADPNEAVEAVPERHSNEVAKQQSPFLQACENTLSLLHKLPQRPDRRYNACPSALGELPMADRLASFTPAPLILFASDILFDTWALTSIREKLPGRPPVADWLHGVAEWEPPQTYVAWREEVKLLTGELLEKHQPDDLLEDYPLKPHELLRDRTERIFKHLQMLATTHPDLPVWIIDDAGPLSVTTLKVLAKSNDNSLQNRTVLLPPAAGGLKSGMLDGKAPFGATRDDYDVADKWMDTDDTPRRARVWDSDARPDRMRLMRTIDTRPDADEMDEENEQPMRRYWRWYVRPRSADDDGSRSARFRQELEPHLKTAEGFAQAIVDKLRLVEPEASAVKLAAKWHDLGKHRKIWQRSIGNRDYPAKVLAKSGGQMRPIDLNNFRHEFGSLIDLQHKPEFRALAPGLQDLVLHLIASHHGRARPHFPAGETFDRERTTDEAAAAVAREVPRRFARLQRQYGRWGLAYLESLLRAADALASQANDANGANPADPTLTSEVARKR